MNRRSFISSVLAFGAAPAFIPITSLMSVRAELLRVRVPYYIGPPVVWGVPPSIILQGRDNGLHFGHIEFAGRNMAEIEHKIYNYKLNRNNPYFRQRW